MGYDPGRHTLEVEFLDGSIYQYDHVTPDQHQALILAASKGAHFNLHIRDCHPYRQILKA